jgi:chromosomal replication initiation ATPase DnaA
MPVFYNPNKGAFIGKNINVKSFMQKVMDCVCEFFNVTEEDIRAKNQKRVAVYPRHIFSAFCLENKKIPSGYLSPRTIALELNKDRTSIYYSHNVVYGEYACHELSELAKDFEAFFWNKHSKNTVK